LRQALKSVQKASETVHAEIFVVDNNSVDGSVDMVRSSFPDVHLIANDTNVGFARANNQAIRQAKGRYLLILNPDTIVSEDTFRVLVDFMDTHPDAGAAGCQIRNPDGTYALESRRAFPTLPVAFFRLTGLSRLFPKSRIFGQYNLSYLPIDEEAEIDALSGSCMLVRSAALYADIHGNSENAPGLFDEGFFMYGEDLDWCYRIQQAGWKILYTPGTHIIHYKGASTKKSELRYVRLFYGAMLRFTEKHLQDSYPPLILWFLQLSVVAYGSITALAHTLQRLTPILLDLFLVWVVVAGLGILRTIQPDIPAFPPLFHWLIAPGFALITICVIVALGGYQGHRRRLGPLCIGVVIAVVILAATSFFIRDIAFSRAVVLASVPACILILSAVRMLQRIRRKGRRRTLFVGSKQEVEWLVQKLDKQDNARLDVLGYITPEVSSNNQASVPHLGTFHHLRDLVVLRNIEDVIFGAAFLSNKVIFTLVQRLRGLSTHTHILPERQKPGNVLRLVHTEDALGVLRSSASRRISDSIIALCACLLHPFIQLRIRLGSNSIFWNNLATRTARWPDILKGRRPLVGYHTEDDYIPPEEWELQPGIFAITETSSSPLRMGPTETERAYWYYVRNQSAIMDWIIVVQALRMMR